MKLLDNMTDKKIRENILLLANQIEQYNISNSGKNWLCIKESINHNGLSNMYINYKNLTIDLSLLNDIHRIHLSIIEKYVFVSDKTHLKYIEKIVIALINSIETYIHENERYHINREVKLWQAQVILFLMVFIILVVTFIEAVIYYD